jgi:transcription elongation factor Elf1
MTGMDEAALIDWYDVVEGVANGRMTGHVCPMCGASDVLVEVEGRVVRARCGACHASVEGRLKQGRDDAYGLGYVPRRRLPKRAPASPPDFGRRRIPQRARAAKTPSAKTTPTRPEWEWQLPAGAGDVDGLSIWMDIITAVHNGRREGHRCPFCSEPLSDITHQRPFLRVRCGQCGEGFEGRVG